MIIRPIYIPFLLFLGGFSLGGCSSLDSNQIRDFLTDTEHQNNDSDPQSANDYDPVLQSTRLALQAQPTPVFGSETTTVKPPGMAQPDTDNIWQRLTEHYQLSDIDNPRIARQKQRYLKHKQYFSTVSQRAEPFMYLIIEAVEQRNMPSEIALLPVIESAFIPHARSNQKAAGLWQFIPSTGRHFGLKQNWWYDARRDVHLSTHAALTYLEQLNKYYKGDWLLTLAAYNAGAGNVNKAVRKNRKQGKPIDYWSLDLPRETKNYIPKLIAVAQIIAAREDYKITLNAIDNVPYLQLVNIDSQIDLSLVAQLTDISIEELKSYNPAIKQWATDPEGPHHLLLPVDKASDFQTQLAQVDDQDRMQYYRHEIRSGESLSVIARKYHLSIKALKTANKLKSNRIRAGKYLMVPLPKGQQLAAVTSTVEDKPLDDNQNRTTYAVRKGDSFWKIARKFNVSHQQLAAKNGLSANDTLAIGQVLTINHQVNQTALAQSRTISYKVKQGDSLYVISRRFNVSINELKRWNDLHSKKYLQPGQELKVYIPSSDTQTI